MTLLQAWGEIRKITSDTTLSDSEKGRKCVAFADIYCALTGDDSLIPPALRKKREQTISSIPKALKQAEQRREAKAKGQVEFFA